MKGLGIYQCNLCKKSFLGMESLRKHEHGAKNYFHTQEIVPPKRQDEVRAYLIKMNEHITHAIDKI